MFVVLAVPTLLLLTVVGLAVDGRAEAFADARRTQDEVALSLRVQGLVHQLQRERGLTNGLLGGADGYSTQVDTQRARVDAALSRLRTDATETAEADALRRLDRLSSVRISVDKGSADRAGTLRFYTAAITALNDDDPATDTVTSGDRQLRKGLDALHALAEAKESIALERGMLNGVFAAGAFQGHDYLDFTEVRAVRVAALARFRQSAAPAQQSALDKAFTTAAAKRAAAYERKAEGGADGSALRAEPTAWWDSMTVLVDDLYGVQQQVGGDTRARARQLSGDAATQLGGYLALGTLIAALVAATAVLASRSITRPLGALVREADDVARTRLPQAVERIQKAAADDPDLIPRLTSGPGLRHGSQEIAEVAAALHNVECTALGLAAEQALLRRNTSESLASLGRRNQGLIRRQLGLITALENQELDPDALARFFELDHLATRMRRNAESLLVLVGEHAPRTRMEAASGLEVLQSAISEVEQYRRVLVAEMEPCRIRGHAIAELSHLLAELLENALSFSPPTEPVEVHAWHDGEEYSIAVVDRGIGMLPPDLERSNARLAGQEAFLVAPTRFLGHYVVGRLARRLHVEVRLYDTPGSGVTALVTLPPQLLVPPASEPEAPAAAPFRTTGHQNVSAMLNNFRAGFARTETSKDAVS